LYATNGQLINSNVQHKQLKSLRAELAAQKRHSEKNLASEREKKERQISYQLRLVKEKVTEERRRD
jgi:hypothetical protein